MASAPFTFGFSTAVDDDDDQGHAGTPRAIVNTGIRDHGAATTEAPVSNVPVVKHDLKAMVSCAVCLLLYVVHVKFVREEKRSCAQAQCICVPVVEETRRESVTDESASRLFVCPGIILEVDSPPVMPPISSPSHTWALPYRPANRMKASCGAAHSTAPQTHAGALNVPMPYAGRRRAAFPACMHAERTLKKQRPS